MAIYNYIVKVFDIDNNLLRTEKIGAKNYSDASGKATDIVFATEHGMTYTMNIVY